MGSSQNHKQIRRNASLIVLAIVIAILACVTFIIIATMAIEDTPFSVGSLVSAVASLTGDITLAMHSWGYLGIFALMVLDASSIPIPSEAILPFAGYLVSTGQSNLWITIAVATAASLAGSLIDYYIGLKGIHALIKHRVLGKVLFSPHQLEVAAGWFSKNGDIVVFFGRVIPIFRTLVSFPAGAVRMALPKFVVLTAAGCLVWNTVLVYLGYYLGSNWQTIVGASRYIIIIAIALFIILIGLYTIRKQYQQPKNSER